VAYVRALPDPRADLAGANRHVQLDATFTYRVQRGDTLSKISKRFYGHAKDWPVLYRSNRIRWADILRTGKRLTIPALPRHIPAAPRELAPPAPVVHHAVLASAPSGGAAPAAPAIPAATTGYSTGGSFQACVIQRESGGNPVAQNPTSTASGLYGFLSTTWTAITGLPGPARAYSVATQNAAFEKEYAEAGTAPWAPYDGC
jgi:hypothetical protein